VVAERGNTSLRGDAAAGAILGAAVTRIAANLVAINLAGHPEDKRLEKGAALAAAAAASAERAMTTTT
jgi:hypothetical protein